MENHQPLLSRLIFKIGLSVLHKMKIVHRDIKSANIFITKDKFDSVIYKIGDLNVSKVAKQGIYYLFK